MQDDDVATTWLNNYGVRKAIHARPVCCPLNYLYIINSIDNEWVHILLSRA